MIQPLDGYDPKSPTLVGPLRGVGDCLVEFPRNARFWLDPALPIYSGDHVRIAVRHGADLEFVVKRVERSSTGRWYACTKNEALPFDTFEPVFGRVPLAIAKVVAVAPPAPEDEHRTLAQQANEFSRGVMAELTRTLAEDWRRHGGPPPRTLFPGLAVATGGLSHAG